MSNNNKNSHKDHCQNNTKLRKILEIMVEKIAPLNIFY